MKNTISTEKNSTLAHITSLRLSERERSRALASLAVVDNMVDAWIAVSKLLHLR
jgi:hypothetical protein